MKKLKNVLVKYGCSTMAAALTFVAMQAATRGCCFHMYQPEAPENLKKFSKNK